MTLPFVFIAIALLGMGLLLRYRRTRARLYRGLARDRQASIAQHAPDFTLAADPLALRADFACDRIVRIGDVLDARTLARLQQEASANREHAERSYIPAHKKGGTLSYEAIHHHAPGCLAVYHSAQLQHWLSDLVGAPVATTADHDQSSCSLLYYDAAGDHIGWHYDHNFYRGRHFTVLLSLINRSTGGGASQGRLQRRLQGAVSEVDTCANSLVVFEGARVFHRATAVAPGDERVMLSMTFCTDPRIHPLKELIRRIKDTAYYGPRALFD